MGILSLLKKTKVPPVQVQSSPTVSIEKKTADYQIVIIQFFYGIENISELHEMEDALRDLINDSGVGEYHGHEISMDFGDGYLFIVGPNAESIYACIRPLLESYYFMDKSIATVRTGNFKTPDAIEKDYLMRYKKMQAL